MVRNVSDSASILIQQPTLDTNTHQTPTIYDENILPTSHSVDDRLHSYQSDSMFLAQLFHRFLSNSQISKLQSTTNEFLSTSSLLISLSQFNEKEQTNNFHYDHIEPAIPEDIRRFVFKVKRKKIYLFFSYFSMELDNILTNIVTDDLDEDILLNSNNHLRSQKQHLSLTEIFPSSNEIQSTVTDSIQIVDNNNSQTNTPVLSTSPKKSIGILKQIDSIRSTKKEVHFADSIGEELEQVCYIESLKKFDHDRLQELLKLESNFYLLPKSDLIQCKSASFNTDLSSNQIDAVLKVIFNFTLLFLVLSFLFFI